MVLMSLAAIRILQVCLAMASPAMAYPSMVDASMVDASTATPVRPILLAAAAVEQEQPATSSPSPAPQQQTTAPANPEDQAPATQTPATQAPAQDQTAAPATGSAKSSATKKSPSSPAKKTTASKSGKHRRKHPVPSQTPATQPKVVVKNGGTADPKVRIAPDITQEQASSQRLAAKQLLAKNDLNLKRIPARHGEADQAIR
jgi:outer membrane biosynthesis protein TonB